MIRGCERGQASVEMLGVLPAVLLVGGVLAQLLAIGYAAVLAGDAAEAGALALASGGDARSAARDALPGWSRAGMRVEVSGGRVSVRLRAPSPLGELARGIEIRSAAAVAAP